MLLFLKLSCYLHIIKSSGAEMNGFILNPDPYTSETISNEDFAQYRAQILHFVKSQRNDYQRLAELLENKISDMTSTIVDANNIQDPSKCIEVRTIVAENYRFIDKEIEEMVKKTETNYFIYDNIPVLKYIFEIYSSNRALIISYIMWYTTTSMNAIIKNDIQPENAAQRIKECEQISSLRATTVENPPFNRLFQDKILKFFGTDLEENRIDKTAFALFYEELMYGQMIMSMKFKKIMDNHQILSIRMIKILYNTRTMKEALDKMSALGILWN